MVEYTYSLDSVFGALADPTRRDILSRVSSRQLTISQIAGRYNLGFAAISKHLMVLEKAGLIIKHRVGRRQFVRARADTLQEASDYLDQYKEAWEARLDSLEQYLNESDNNDR
ncbi:MAG TPA: metalloregulator ArsR/SmtB family transcription factor [Candidatus Saccharimonadales bacterium]|nr:metalloregulator ArsR/SmtB family transcription factor [Candidatus Saccharimonadales bacterium]